MISTIVKNTLRSIFALFFGLLILALAYSLFNGYTGTVNAILAALHDEGHTQRVFDLITAKNFFGLQLFIASLAILSGLFLLYFRSIYRVLENYIHDFIYSIAHLFKTFFASEGKYVLIIPLLSSFYFAITFPVSHGEACTYLNFTSRGIMSSIAYYPDPNNHVLHSIITNFTKYIPFLSPLLSLRIVPVFINLFTWIFVWAFLNTYFNKKVAVIVVAIASMLSMSIYYGYLSRGYPLFNLFFITSLYASFNIIKRNNRTKDWVWFSLSSILGFYALPSFLYPFITLNLLILLLSSRSIVKQMISNTIIIIVVFILYLPILIVNGADAIINNGYVSPIPRSEVIAKLPSFLFYLPGEIAGINPIYVILCLAASLVIMLLKGKKEYRIMFILFILSPPLLLLIHSVIPFNRTFIYYAFIITFLIVMPWSEWLIRMKTRYILFVLMAVQCLLLYNGYNKILFYENYDLVASDVIQQIEGNKKYLTDDPLFDAPLRFELQANGYKGAEVKYYSRALMSADSLTNYDFVIIEKSVDKTKEKIPKIVTEYYNVY